MNFYDIPRSDSQHGIRIVDITQISTSFVYLCEFVAQYGKALGYRSGSPAFEPCHRHIRYALFG